MSNFYKNLTNIHKLVFKIVAIDCNFYAIFINYNISNYKYYRISNIVWKVYCGKEIRLLGTMAVRIEVVWR